jgi:signal transduction histidine kinase
VAVLYIPVTVLVILVLMTRAYETARSIGDDELMDRAQALARSLPPLTAGTAEFDLLARLPEFQEAARAASVFAIRDRNGRLLAASPTRFGEVGASEPPVYPEPRRFSIEDLGARHENYSGITTLLQSAAGPVVISVARSAAAGDRMYALLRKFIHDIVWVVSFLVLATIGVAVWAVHGGLKPIREVSARAATIGPAAISVRLPDRGLPSEIRPLVDAVNRALDRLERGFVVQREFTANAAHELRTPLAIITGALDSMDGGPQLAKIKSDVARMNRLVGQLLRVARLDAVALDVSQRVALNAVAGAVVEAMAPWAIARQRSLAFVGCPEPVVISGNAQAIEDAVRNLIENAVAHTPGGTEVTIEVKPGQIIVADRGDGVPAAQRSHIFERFRRGSDRQIEGAGLGLAIVKQIMDEHRGQVTVVDNPGGGARFILDFPCSGTPSVSTDRA